MIHPSFSNLHQPFSKSVVGWIDGFKLTFWFSKRRHAWLLYELNKHGFWMLFTIIQCLKRRKLHEWSYINKLKGEKILKAMGTLHGLPFESGSTTPLPDKKLLIFILDRLQKKDTHVVFS